MKQPKKLFRYQKEILKKKGLNWYDYMLLTEDNDTFTVTYIKDSLWQGNDYYEIDTTKKQITGTLITDEPEFNEKDIYKDLIDRYVVLGMDRVKMKPYKTR